MEVTRDVILDLLPLYLAGEASADTQALVKEYLDHDQDLAQLARRWRERLPGPPPPPASADAQVLAYREARRRIAVKTIVVAAVMAAGIIALTAVVALIAFFSAP
jgi:ferric-dicitrate binding protein FerR (iron transport regulator)